MMKHVYENRVQALALESRRIPLQSEHWTAAKMPFKSNGKGSSAGGWHGEACELTAKTMSRFENGIVLQ
jgi:hypothetical protein